MRTDQIEPSNSATSGSASDIWLSTSGGSQHCGDDEGADDEIAALRLELVGSDDADVDALSTGSGDCKDYAIAKYVALMEAGIAEENLRLVIVRDLALGEDHAIVATRLGQDWIMLDNRWLTLVQDVKMRRVVPLFVLDRDGLRQFSHEKTYSNSTMPFGNVARIRSGSRIS